MKPYEIIEHTADVGLKAHGATLKELFENAAKGMFEIIAGTEAYSRTFDHAQDRQVHKQVKIKKEVEYFEELLVDWLSELLYLLNKEKILFRDFKVLELNNSGIAGEASGKKIDLALDTLQTEIKAVTFHGLKIEEHKNGFSCNIIFDV